MTKPVHASVLSVFVCLLTGCGDEGGFDAAAGDEEVGEVAAALVGDNALSPNALSPNALSPNALSPNALSPNALSALQADTVDGASARELLKYTVSCALDATQSFAFSWTDARRNVHDEVYPGLLGIAPAWATSALTDDTQKRLVSACLAARVNWYDVSVVISMRSQEEPFRTWVQSPEIGAYPYIEGAFWGNLFTPAPYLNACHVPANAAHSRAAQRDCATGHLSNGLTLPCGMIALVGSCDTWCNNLVGGYGSYTSCVDRPGIAGSPTTKSVVTTALP